MTKNASIYRKELWHQLYLPKPWRRQACFRMGTSTLVFCLLACIILPNAYARRKSARGSGRIFRRSSSARSVPTKTSSRPTTVRPTTTAKPTNHNTSASQSSKNTYQPHSNWSNIGNNKYKEKGKAATYQLAPGRTDGFLYVY